MSDCNKMLNVLKPERQKPLQRPRSRWDDSIKMELNEHVRGLVWVPLARNTDQLQACEHNNERLGSMKGWECLEWLRNC